MRRFNVGLSRSLIVAVLFLVSACGTSSQSETGYRGPKNPEPPPPQGWDVGGGGEHYAGEFVQIGYELFTLLSEQPIPDISATQFLEAVRNTKVLSERELELNGSPKDAKNYPRQSPPSIVLSRVEWEKLKFQRHEKVFLVLHEYLEILGIDDANYSVSRRMDRGSVCTRTPAVRLELERHFGKSCYRIFVDDLQHVQSLELSKKEIKGLKVGDFDHMYRLESLNLANNEISQIPPGVFKDLDSLVRLHFEHNHIVALEGHRFEGLSKATFIDLSHNNIQRIEEAALSGLSSIRHIGPRSSRKAFTNGVLILDGNEIHHLGARFLSRLSPESVSLCNGYVHSMASSALPDDLSPLYKLSLCLSIRVFSDSAANAAFTGIRNVRHLGLSIKDGSYSDIPSDFWRNLNGIEILTLSFFLDEHLLSKEALITIGELPSIKRIELWGARWSALSDRMDILTRNFDCLSSPNHDGIACVKK